MEWIVYGSEPYRQGWQLFHQTVNLVIYGQQLIKGTRRENSTEYREVQLSKDELNALRYASGYVPMKFITH